MMKTTSPIVETSVILAAVDSLLIKINDALVKYYRETFKYLTAPVAKVRGGRKYLKIVLIGSQVCVYFFVDLSTGDILKPATFTAPALNFARGNVLSNNALSKLTPHGTGDSIDNLQAILDR